MLTLRPYQQDAINNTYDWMRQNDGNAVIVLPTGSGKSLVMAELIRDACTQWDGTRIIVLAHVKELLEQNSRELRGHWPEVDMGIYSAGMKSRDLHNQVLVASIQSIYKKGFDVGRVDLVLVDEVHLVPRHDDGMYRTFLGNLKLNNPHMRVIGLTATDFRLDSGRLTGGKDAFFQGISHETNVRELIDAGYLCWLRSKKTVQELDVEGVKVRGGEFIPGELEKAVDIDTITRAAVQEIIAAGQDRKAWLVFCSGVSHARHVADELEANGIPAGCVTGEMNMRDREDIISAFRAGEIRALCNMNVLTTGFNVPHVDLIALLRPTQSTGLYIQMVGRGSRNAPGKQNCLILDFAQNIERHGPIDAARPKISDEKEEKGKGKAPVKACPMCGTYNPIAARWCEDCEYEFPEPETQLKPKADEKHSILSEEVVPQWLEVRDVVYSKHIKRSGDGPPTMRVDYRVGMLVFSEWICFEHSGFAGEKAATWWVRQGGERVWVQPDGTIKSAIPRTVSEALDRDIELKKPVLIQVRKEGKYDRITGYRFAVDTGKDAGDERDTAGQGSDGRTGEGGQEVERIRNDEKGVGSDYLGTGTDGAAGDVPF